MGLGKDAGVGAVAVAATVAAGMEVLGCAGELLPVEVDGGGGEVTVSTRVGVSNIACRSQRCEQDTFCQHLASITASMSERHNKYCVPYLLW